MLSNCLVSVYRLIYNNKWVSQKSLISEHEWYLTTISEDSQLMKEWMFWKLFKLSIQKIIDIRESDFIRINWKEYIVKGISSKKWGSLSLTTIILEAWVESLSQ